MMSTLPKRILRTVVKDGALGLALIGFLIFISVFSGENVFTLGKMLDLLAMSSILGILTIGQSMVIFTRGLDLSVGNLTALFSVVLAMTLPWGVLPACLIAFGTCISIGIINGLLITRARMAPFIATLGTMNLCLGIALVVTRGKPVAISGEVISFLRIFFYSPTVPPLSIFVWFAALGLFIYLFRTRAFFRHFYVCGENEYLAYISGINVAKIKFSAYLISSILAGVAGVLYTARAYVGYPIGGGAYALQSLAAAVIGGVSFSGGKGNLWGAMIGVLMLHCALIYLDYLGISPFFMRVFTGGILLIAIFMYEVQTKR